ncbi:hypothetical protein SEA_SICARIUS2_27 [Arthrobacter phage Sicarius2]|uniref:Uncharacterized protein n=1 Tax=Arthrobacter phage Sicarius2 TaxID=2836090 RepID=A0A8F3E711_9CAUD|nr:hypothetical protein SEA_SICARIUS2_27 [Arthrobacter phage Sicarius2]
MIGKLLGWTKYKVTPEEKARSEAALAEAQRIEQQALAVKSESARLGDSLRRIQQENHVGFSLTHAYRKARNV